MAWGKLRNLQASLKDFLDAQIVIDSLVGDDGTTVTVRVGRKNDNNWVLPCISLYVESEDLTKRIAIGSNKRDEKELIIIDIYANNDGERIDFAKWLTDSINNGWQFYSYVYNPSNPELPTKNAGDWVSVDFLTNTKVKLGQNVDIIDAHRHRVSINVWCS